MKNIRGFTYIEIVIALIILGIGMIPILRMYLKINQSNQFINELWFVHQVTENFVQQIQSNNYQGLSQFYFTSASHLPGCLICDKDQQAVKHRFYLDNTIKNKLQNAKINFTSHNDYCLLDIKWRSNFKEESQHTVEFYC